MNKKKVTLLFIAAFVAVFGIITIWNLPGILSPEFVPASITTVLVYELSK